MGGSHGAPRRPLVLEDFLRLRRIGDPCISPDGRWVVYVEQHADAASRRWRSALWMVPADGSAPPRPLTDESSHADSPAWAPDGQRIAFLSDRSGRTEVWVLDISGGEAAMATTGPVTPLAPLAWSPDGREIAFAAWTRVNQTDEVPYPGAPAASGGLWPPGADRPRVIARTDYMEDGVGWYGDRFRQIYRCAVGEAPAEPLRVCTLEANCDWPAWSPDGALIAFVAKGEGDRSFFASGDLCLADKATGSARLLWQPGGKCASKAAWSGDGRKLATVADDGSCGPYTTTEQLWEVDAATGKATCLTAGSGLQVGQAVYTDWRVAGYTGPSWSPDGWVYLARSQGQSHIYRTPAVPLTAGARAVSGYSLSHSPKNTAGIQLVYHWSTMADPGAISVGGREVARAGGPWDEVSVAPSERLTYEGEGGQPLEGWVLVPPVAGPLPAVLSIHGGPHNMYGEAFSLPLQILAAAGNAVICLNPRGSQGYGQPFASAVCGDWGGVDYRDLMAGLDAAATLLPLDPGRLYATGGSYGGYMTNWIISRTDRFRAAVSSNSISNWHSFYGTSDIGPVFTEIQNPGFPWSEPPSLLARSPLLHAENVSTPVLLVHAEDDQRCPVSQSEEFYRALRRLGKTAVLVRYPRQSHAMSHPLHAYDRLARTLAWFGYYSSKAGPLDSGG